MVIFNYFQQSGYTFDTLQRDDMTYIIIIYLNEYLLV